jgi:hypothetical protein
MEAGGIEDLLVAANHAIIMGSAGILRENNELFGAS